jgi:hypothetical protein
MELTHHTALELAIADRLSIPKDVIVAGTMRLQADGRVTLDFHIPVEELQQILDEHATQDEHDRILEDARPSAGAPAPPP